MQNLLPYTLFFPLVLEGLGIQFGREITIFLIIFASPIFFVHMLFRKKEIIFPKKAGFLFLLFIICTLISTVFGVSAQKSVQYTLYLISLFLVFLISYNFKAQLEKPIIIFIFILSFLFIFYSIFLDFHLFNLLIPQKGYQFVFSKFGSHNHLGDFLVLPVTICIYYLYTRKRALLAVCYLLPTILFIFFSFSRSAYISVAISTLFLHLYFFRKSSSPFKLLSRLVILILLLSAIFYFVTLSPQAKDQPVSKNTYNFLVQKEGLSKYKDVTGSRFIYLQQALFSIQKHPLTGIGPNNFIYASRSYAKNQYELTEVAHNIFLEVLVGQGILGLIPFLGLIIISIIKSRKNALYFAMIAMLANFQTDYTYQIYSFLLLFFVIAGVVSTEKEWELHSFTN